MNVIATTSFTPIFTLKCSFTEVNENLFLEVFKSKDWSHPCIKKVLNKSQCYPHFKWHIVYICYCLKIKLVEYKQEMEQMDDMINGIAMDGWYYDRDCYLVCALAGEITSPLHVIHSYVKMEDQPYVVEKLLQHGFDPNEPCKIDEVKQPYITIWYDAINYTPIYYSTHLTAPILIKYGAQLNTQLKIDGVNYQPLDRVMELLDLPKYYTGSIIETSKQLDFLYAYLVANGAVSGMC